MRKALSDYFNIPGIVDSIETYAKDWGQYDIREMSILEKEVLKNNLKLIIKETILSFDAKITEKDLLAYNEIQKKLADDTEAAAIAAEFGSLNLLKYYRKLNASLPSLRHATKNGHQEIIDYLIQNGVKDYNDGAYGAIEGGYEDIFEDMIDRGAKNYDKMLRVASLFGNMKFVHRVLELGSENYEEALIDAARGGHVDIMRLMIGRGAKDYLTAARSAASGGHMKAFNFAFDLFNKDIDKKILATQDKKAVDTLISHRMYGYDRLLLAATESSNIDIVHKLLDLGASTSLNAINNASTEGNIDIVELLISRADKKLDLSDSLWKAIINGRKEVVEYLLKYVPGDHDFLMSQAINSGYHEIARIIRKYDREHPSEDTYNIDIYF